MNTVPARLRPALLGTGAAALAEAVVLALVAARTGSVALPVTAHFPGGPGAAEHDGRFLLATVAAAPAASVPLVLAAVARLAGASPALLQRYAGAGMRGGQGLAWLSALLTTPITAFLVAQLNGVDDVGALVLTYAATSGAVLCCLLHELVAVRHGPRELPLWFAAALGIVPWGVIALHQVGAGVIGAAPSGAVRVTTLLVLAASAAAFLAVWRASRLGRPSIAVVVLGVLPPAVLAAAVVLAVHA